MKIEYLSINVNKTLQSKVGLSIATKNEKLGERMKGMHY
jgi:hypothetical protein